jgi:hypothetical protein
VLYHPDANGPALFLCYPCRANVAQKQPNDVPLQNFTTPPPPDCAPVAHTSHAKLPSQRLLDVLASQVRNGCALNPVTHRMG